MLQREREVVRSSAIIHDLRSSQSGSHKDKPSMQGLS